MKKLKKIFIMSQKGGVGKTTLADEIIFAIERHGSPYSFYELDPQGGTIHKPVKNLDAEFIIVDTPGGLQADTIKWIQSADIVILPTKPSSRDLQPFLHMGSIIRKNMQHSASVIFVVNMMNPRFRATKDFMNWMEAAIIEKRDPFGNDYNWCFGLIPQSEMAVQAAAYRKSIIDYAPKSEIAKCLQRMIKDIFKQLGV